MSLQKLYDKYKKEICSCCKNANLEDCNICKTLDGVKCCGYIKDKNKIKRTKINNCYVRGKYNEI